MSNEIRSTNRCRPCGSGSTWGSGDCSDVFGPGWSYIGENSCNYDCIVAGASPGTSARCQMTSYTGTPSECCINGRSTTGACNPIYTLTSANCDDSLISYCSQGARIAADPICLRWRDNRPSSAYRLMANYCSNDPRHPECLNWCKRLAANKDGFCDSIYNSWCNVHPNDPICTCIKSPLQDPKIGLNPKCNDKKCIDTGYLTQNMINTNCPDITNCSIQPLITNSGVQVTGINIDQKCGNNNATNDAAVTNPASPINPSSPISNASPDSSNINRNQSFIIFIVVLFIAFLLSLQYQYNFIKWIKI